MSRLRKKIDQISIDLSNDWDNDKFGFVFGYFALTLIAIGFVTALGMIVYVLIMAFSKELVTTLIIALIVLSIVGVFAIFVGHGKKIR